MTRNVLVVSSAESAEQLQRTLDACSSLEAFGMHCVFAAEDIGRLQAQFQNAPSDKNLFTNQELEIVLVLGGDGSLHCHGLVESPIKGTNGNIEYLSLMRFEPLDYGVEQQLVDELFSKG